MLIYLFIFLIIDPLTWSKKFLGYWLRRFLTLNHQLLSSMRAMYLALPHCHDLHGQAVSITRQLFFVSVTVTITRRVPRTCERVNAT